MIPCFICGKDIEGGWWTGFPPAPDSQKTGLCARHDTPENRALALAEWDRRWKNSVTVTQRVEAEKHVARQPFTLVIQFKDGGLVTLAAYGYSVLSEGGILAATLLNHEKQFFPLQQIRSFKILPQGPDSQTPQPALPR